MAKQDTVLRFINREQLGVKFRFTAFPDDDLLVPARLEAVFGELDVVGARRKLVYDVVAVAVCSRFALQDFILEHPHADAGKPAEIEISVLDSPVKRAGAALG